MKKVILGILAIGILSSLALSKGKDKSTFVEKVVANQPVKVFFNFNPEMIDKDHERKLKQADKNAKTDIRTTLPSDFYGQSLKNDILSHLNSGLEMENAFVEADLSTVSKKATSMSGLDLSGMENGLYAVFNVEGEYTRFVSKKDVDGATVFEWKNSLQIMSKLFFYEVIDGKMKSYGSKTGIVLGLVNTPTKITNKMESLSYMESNFNDSTLLEQYKEKSLSNIDDFTRRKLKKHKKVVSKR